MESPGLRRRRPMGWRLSGRTTVPPVVGALPLLVARAALSLAVGVHRASAATPGDQIAAIAASQAGVPYCDGGGTINGPTHGETESGCGPGVRGYDCMS